MGITSVDSQVQTDVPTPPDYMNLEYQNLYANGRMRTTPRVDITLPRVSRSKRRVSRQRSFEVRPIVETDEMKLSRGQLPISRDYVADRPELFYQNDNVRPVYYQDPVYTLPVDPPLHRLYSTLPIPRSTLIAPPLPERPNCYDRIALYDPYYSAVAASSSPRMYRKNSLGDHKFVAYRRLQAHAAATFSGRRPSVSERSSRPSAGKRKKHRVEKRGLWVKSGKNSKPKYLDNFLMSGSHEHETDDRTVDNPIYNGQEQTAGLF